MPEIPQVTLHELPELARSLAARATANGFIPGVVVYVERGARLLAWELCRDLKCKAIGVTVQRRGGRLKSALAGVMRHFPRAVRDMLRRWDERWLWSRTDQTPRTVASTFTGSLAGVPVLLVDDAADSGRTIAGCVAWLAAHGAPRAATRIAVLAATTPAGRAVVDCWLLERNTRLPWSADSPEKPAADAAWAQRKPAAFD